MKLAAAFRRRTLRNASGKKHVAVPQQIGEAKRIHGETFWGGGLKRGGGLSRAVRAHGPAKSQRTEINPVSNHGSGGQGPSPTDGYKSSTTSRSSASTLVGGFRFTFPQADPDMEARTLVAKWGRPQQKSVCPRTLPPFALAGTAL